MRKGREGESSELHVQDDGAAVGLREDGHRAIPCLVAALTSPWCDGGGKPLPVDKIFRNHVVEVVLAALVPNVIQAAVLGCAFGKRVILRARVFS